MCLEGYRDKAAMRGQKQHLAGAFFSNLEDALCHCPSWHHKGQIFCPDLASIQRVRWQTQIVLKKNILEVIFAVRPLTLTRTNAALQHSNKVLRRRPTHTSSLIEFLKETREDYSRGNEGGWFNGGRFHRQNATRYLPTLPSPFQPVIDKARR